MARREGREAGAGVRLLDALTTPEPESRRQPSLAYLDRRNGSWRYDFQCGGQRVTRRGFRTREEAQAAGLAAKREMGGHRNPWLARRREEATAGTIAPRDAQARRAVVAAICASERAPADPTTVGFVYLVNAENGLTKVGRAVDPAKRIGLFQTGSPCRLWLIGCIATNDTMRMEAQLHREFQHRWSHGEWFDLETPTLRELCRAELVVYDYLGKVRWLTKVELRKYQKAEPLTGWPASWMPAAEDHFA